MLSSRSQHRSALNEGSGMDADKRGRHAMVVVVILVARDTKVTVGVVEILKRFNFDLKIELSSKGTIWYRLVRCYTN